ncbi:MAG: phage tail protein I [Gorillibacterium sp.]|nr:phage tail protein I [Gorillibacterium sp.]
MDLSNLELFKLQTKLMRNDEAVMGMSAALSQQFQEIAAAVKGISIYSQIDQLPEEALDILAWQFGADWYDANSNVEIKRQAIKDVLYLARIRGTPAAVQRVVEIYFGDGAVEEWFDYAGEPYHFRVVTNNSAATNEQALLFLKAVESVKNLRSKLDAVIIQSTESMDLYKGFVLQMIDTITVKQVV